MVRLTPSDALLSTIKEYNNLPASCRGDIINTEALLSIDHQTIQKISESLLESVNVPRDGSHNLGRDGASLEHYRLHYLLRGCAVYIPPKPPKQEQTEEYKALMKKLRQQAEEASYKALTSALSPGELHGEIAGGVGEDDYTLKDLKSDLSLIANVVLSVLATAGAVWAAASGWAVPARFAMAFTSSLVVCLAEVVVLGGYFRRIGEAKSAEKKMVEKKEVLKTWVMKEDSWSVQ